MTLPKGIDWLPQRRVLKLLDQRRLPDQIKFIECARVVDVENAIIDMVVRGAPAIGVTAAYGLALAANIDRDSPLEETHARVRSAASRLRETRPTAVNLMWAIDEVLRRLEASSPDQTSRVVDTLIEIAGALANEDVAINKGIASAAMEIVPASVTFLHHCNTGSIATIDYGTAMGVIRTAHEHGKNVHVFVDETRPRLQGARLTAWELDQLGISYEIIVDGASGHVMKTKHVDMCVVGCDRVAANGDVANKIGTYNLAIAARFHNVPFYVAAPTTSIDMQCPGGTSIEIEERSIEELTMIDDHRVAVIGARAFNPAFDITPAELVTGIITELGIVYPPYKEGLAKLF